VTIPNDLKAAAELYQGLSENELFRTLVSEDDEAAFSEGGRLARGREIFQNIWREVGHLFCQYYRASGKTFGDQVNTIALLATPLLGNPSFQGVSVVAFTALAVKIGAEKLCGTLRS
jgi:hypothetical protein